MRKKTQAESEAKRQAQRKALLEKYGGEEHMAPTPLRDAMVVENEKFIEYDETGAIKGAPKKAAKSKYPEDVLNNNHTSVWGSWWHNFDWGYACCFSTVKNSYCTGEDGKKAFLEADSLLMLPGKKEAEGPSYDPEKGDGSRESRDMGNQNGRKDASSSGKKRTLMEIQSGISEEELESYKRSRLAADDPMAAFTGKDEVA